MNNVDLAPSLPRLPWNIRLGRLLRLEAGIWLVLALAMFFAGLFPLSDPWLRLAPFDSNAVTRASLMALCALYAAGFLSRRIGLITVVIVGHVVGAAAMLAILLFGDAAASVRLGPWAVSAGDMLRAQIAVELLAAASLWLLRWKAKAERDRVVVEVSPERGELTSAERRLRTLLKVLGTALCSSAVLYGAGPIWPESRPFVLDAPIAAHSVVKVLVFGLVCLYVSRELRRRMPVLGIVTAGHTLSTLFQAVYYFRGLAVPYGTPVGSPISIEGALVGGVVLDGILVLVLFAAYQAAWTARYGLVFLRPMEFRSLMALSEVLITGPEKPIRPEDVAMNVDGHVRRIRARRRWVHRAALFALEVHPLLYLKPPLSQLDPDWRLEHLKRHFFRPWRPRYERSYKPWQVRKLGNQIRFLIQASIRVAQQLSYLGYYNDRRVHKTIGYEYFSERERSKALQLPPPRRHPLTVLTPPDLEEDVLETDICIIGSGAAGAILAHELIGQGHEVLLIERGAYVEPRRFSEDEVEMIGRLYADGVFQQTEDFRFTVLQGSCVGGTTVVNNAVSFDPPEEILDAWLDPAQYDTGLHRSSLLESLAAVRKLVSIAPQTDATLNPSALKFLKGAALHPASASLKVGVVEANIEQCFGCGYCNMGCRFGRKLSMLDTVLPAAQAKAPDRLRIVAECRVDRLRVHSGPTKHVADALATLANGRQVRIRANKFVVAAGTIASSFLLQESGIGQHLPVGQHLSFNMGAALTAEFGGEKLRAFDGLQISHFGRPRPDAGYVFETWWNPPVAQALNMPGWFGDHYQNMRRYDELMAVGVLVGTDHGGTVRRATTGGAGVDFTPSARDLATLSSGLGRLGEILFAAGATRLMVNAWGYEEIRRVDQLAGLCENALRPGYLALGSGHPQGGNAISKNPRLGVVDSDFRVHGYDNLYVCDASVFPSSLTVNPQLTVMTLAHHAATWIGGNPRRPRRQTQPARVL
jgi:choline dehydrogenase-like flavoprotein